MARKAKVKTVDLNLLQRQAIVATQELREAQDTYASAREAERNAAQAFEDADAAHTKTLTALNQGIEAVKIACVVGVA